MFYRTVRTAFVYFLYRTHFFVKNYATHIKYRVEGFMLNFLASVQA